MSTHHHTPVMAQEVIDALGLQSDGVYLDATFGRGGHTRLILEHLGPRASLLAVDRDLTAILEARALQAEEPRLQVQHTSFAELGRYLAQDLKFDGVLLDLGVSSPQLADPERGFSFQKDGPLDMRMDTSCGLNASQWLAKVSEDELARVLKTYGEERYAKRIAQAIKKAGLQRPIERTGHLAQVIKDAHPAWPKHHHAATKSFQGIRIFINDELREIEDFLSFIPERLAVGGRVVVLSFHSLEDRLTKRKMQALVQGPDIPARLPLLHSQLAQSKYRRHKKQLPSPAEINTNPRARSAVLRVIERIAL